jgi:glyoxylase-like metal-dependent hydrolase (beta-lactamase superfamily II)
MRTLALDVHQLSGTPPNAVNVYLVGELLIDAGTPSARRRIVRQLSGRAVDAHLVTHAHADHFGSSHAICERLGLPLWTGERDADAIETGRWVPPPTRVGALLSRAPTPPAHPVARRLREGDTVGAGFSVLDVPGHSPGHIALWREADRTLIAGDVFFNLPRLGPPPRSLTVDPDANRTSMRRLAELRPALVLFGHGPPLRDAERLARVADRHARGYRARSTSGRV